MIEKSARGLRVQRMTFLSGKQLLLLWRGKVLVKGFQRQGDAEFEPLDPRIIDHSLGFAFKLLKAEKIRLPDGIKVEELKGMSLKPVQREALGIDLRKAYYKGEPCWVKSKILCQEGFCHQCAIYTEAQLCLGCWEERQGRVKLEYAPSQSLPNRFFCSECGKEYVFEYIED